MCSPLTYSFLDVYTIPQQLDGNIICSFSMNRPIFNLWHNRELNPPATTQHSAAIYGALVSWKDRQWRRLLLLICIIQTVQFVGGCVCVCSSQISLVRLPGTTFMCCAIIVTGFD
jgi:hypothetical protein